MRPGKLSDYFPRLAHHLTSTQVLILAYLCPVITNFPTAPWVEFGFGCKRIYLMVLLSF